MSETTPTTTPGAATSEFRLTQLAIYIGLALETVATVLHAFQDAGVAAPWIPAVLAVVGALLQVASVLGYQKARTLAKVGAPLVSPPRP